MEWSQFAIMIIAFVGLFFWNRSESRSDYRHMDSKMEATRALVAAIHDEMKDFHMRLYKLEKERK